MAFSRRPLEIELLWCGGRSWSEFSTRLSVRYSLRDFFNPATCCMEAAMRIDIHKPLFARECLDDSPSLSMLNEFLGVVFDGKGLRGVLLLASASSEDRSLPGRDAAQQ